MSYSKTPLGMHPNLADLSLWEYAIHTVNEANGWNGDGRSVSESCILIASEVFEAFQDYRDGRKPNEIFYTHDKKCPDSPSEEVPGPYFIDSEDYILRLECCTPKPKGIPTEFADVFIRLLDESRRLGIDLGYEAHRKLCYNTTRGYRHGGKVV